MVTGLFRPRRLLGPRLLREVTISQYDGGIVNVMFNAFDGSHPPPLEIRHFIQRAAHLILEMASLAGVPPVPLLPPTTMPKESA